MLVENSTVLYSNICYSIIYSARLYFYANCLSKKFHILHPVAVYNFINKVQNIYLLMFLVGNILLQIIMFGNIKVDANDEVITRKISLGILNTRAHNE